MVGKTLFFSPSVITISTVLEQLLSFSHLSMLYNLNRLSTLLAGTMRYISSAYLASRLSGLIGVRSAALTTIAGTSCDGQKCRDELTEFSTVSVSPKEVYHPMEDTVWDIQLNQFSEEFRARQRQKLWRNPKQ